MPKYNPRFVAYAASNANTPEQQLIADREQYPSGQMVGFMVWIQERQRAFLTQTGCLQKNSLDNVIGMCEKCSFEEWDKFLGVT